MRELDSAEYAAVTAGIGGEAVAKTVALSWVGLFGGVAIAGSLGVGALLTMGIAGAIATGVAALMVYHAD